MKYHPNLKTENSRVRQQRNKKRKEKEKTEEKENRKKKKKMKRRRRRKRKRKRKRKSKSAVADGKALSLARTQLGHKVSLLIVYAERIIIISHHTKFELANLKR